MSRQQSIGEILLDLEKAGIEMAKIAHQVRKITHAIVESSIQTSNVRSEEVSRRPVNRVAQASEFSGFSEEDSTSSSDDSEVVEAASTLMHMRAGTRGTVADINATTTLTTSENHGTERSSENNDSQSEGSKTETEAESDDDENNSMMQGFIQKVMSARSGQSHTISGGGQAAPTAPVRGAQGGRGGRPRGTTSATPTTPAGGGRGGRARATPSARGAPKSLPPIEKQNRILAYLQSSLTVHTIKDLEKSLPAVASINGMAVKDYLQALSDEGRIRVEKIGSGNWYWSFASEEKKAREDVMGKLQDEKVKAIAALEEMEGKVKDANALRGQDPDREALIERRLVLEHESEILRKELEGYKDADPGEVDRRRKEIKFLQAKAEKWTDNIGILEGQMLSSLGGDREKLDGIKREVYGDEYVDGEGLREL